jgi:hypothetical protein
VIVPQQQIAQKGIPRVSVNLQRSAQAIYTGGLVQLAKDSALNPFRTTAFISPFGAEFSTDNVGGAPKAYSFWYEVAPMPTVRTWQRIRLRLPDITGSPVTPTGVWFALANGGTPWQPTLNGSACVFQAATVVAPVAGSNASPRATPGCAYVTLPPSGASRTIVFRIQYPADSTITVFNMGTTSTDYPLGTQQPTSQGDITGNPSTQSGWNFSFGVVPAHFLEYDQIDESIVTALAVGDSFTRGYDNINGGRGPWDHMKAAWVLGSYPKLSILNLGRAGHKTADISLRLQSLLQDLDVGVVLRQVASVNDKDGGMDFTVPAVAGFRAVLDADAAFVAAANKVFIPFQGPGQSGLAAGAYGRFIGIFDASFSTAYPQAVRAVDGVITNVGANGTYLASMSSDGNLHPNNSLGQPTWGAAFSPILVSNLAAMGYSV